MNSTWLTIQLSGWDVVVWIATWMTLTFVLEVVRDLWKASKDRRREDVDA